MRRFAVITAAVLLVASGSVVSIKYWQSYSRMKTAEEVTRGRYGQAVEALAEIQENLNSIALGDTTVQMLSKGLQTERNLSQSSSQEVIDRIAEVRGSILRSRERITRLEADLKKKGIKVAGLQKFIANLRRTMDEKEALIAQLTGTADSLQTRVTSLESEVLQIRGAIRLKDDAIEERRRELATVYYIVGKKKDLSSSGVIVARGGILGLGKTLQPSGRINENLMTALDTDQESVIQMPSARARVLSPQPISSYELKLVDGRMELHILDPREFRKFRQLIIMTA